VQYLTIDLYVHQHRHLGDLLSDQLVESTEVDLHRCLLDDVRHLVEAESDDRYLAEEELDDHLALCAQQARLVVAQQKVLAHLLSDLPLQAQILELLVVRPAAQLVEEQVLAQCAQQDSPTELVVQMKLLGHAQQMPLALQLFLLMSALILVH